MWNWTKNVNNGEDLRKMLRWMLLKGDLPVGTMLPSLSKLSELSGLHRNTVKKVYNQLADRGLIIPKHGKGFFAMGKSRSELRFLFVTGDLYGGIFTSVYHESLYRECRRYAEEIGCSLDLWIISPTDCDDLANMVKLQFSSYDGAMLFVNGLENYLPILESPITLVCGFGKNEHLYNSIGYSRQQAVSAAVSNMIDSGRRKIGLIVTDMDQWYTQEKIVAYLSTMLAAGLPVNPGYIVNISECDREGTLAQAELEAYFQNNPLLEGYVCTAAGHGKQLLACLKKHGIKVPDQVAIIGYDEFDFDKDLTQVILPRTQIARRCLDFLIENVGLKPINIRQELPAQLHIGKTT